MKSFIFAVVLSLIVSLCTSDAVENNQKVDYRLASLKYNNRSGSPYACTRPGVIACSRDSCLNRVKCNQQLNEEPFDTCTTGTICIDGACVKPPTKLPCNPYQGLKFECQTVGVFPDPGDCTVYHVCTRKFPDNELEEIKQVDSICEGLQNEYGFNPKTGLCDKKLTNRECDTVPVPICPGEGSWALTANTVFYYNCDAHTAASGWLYPYQKRCPNGKKFYATGGICK